MSTLFRFGSAEVDALHRVARIDGQPLPLGARALDVLLALLDPPGELVTKDGLLARAWPGLVVEEGNVHVQISALRKAFGADAIATVPGLGYRFALPVDTRAAPRASLPAMRTAFIGRSAELAHARRQLDATRLLTLTGIGGSGKTRLALRLAEQAAADFAGGVWFVDLAPLQDGDQVPATIATTLGLRLAMQTPTAAALARRLEGERTLLLLDNCEHVLDAVATLAAPLLAEAPRLTLLCTSREALAVDGETCLPVRPLALPTEGAAPEAIVQTESVQLFIDRARSASPGLALDANEVLRDAARLCRRLDGIPLAIELAAARTRMLALPQILALLDERFRLLAGGSRALPRQQTLEAVVQWSYEQLAPTEQRVLRTLAVCHGGCDLQAVVALLGGEWDELAALDSLSLLADKSLITVEHRAQGPARYVMLETVRHYALGRLAEREELPPLRDRHRDHFLARAQTLETELLGQAPGAALTALDPDRDNLLRAFAWCQSDDGARAGLRMAVALKAYWSSCGLLPQGLEATRAALAHPGAATRDTLRAAALSALAQQCQWTGAYAEAERHAGEALAIAREHGDDARQIAQWRQLSQIRREQGDSPGARRHIDESLALARRIGQEREVCNALAVTAELHLHDGELDRAEPLYEEVLALRQRLGMPVFAQAVAALNLASIAISLRASGRAHDRLLRARDLALRTGSRYLGLGLIDVVSALAALDGDAAAAVRLHAASTRQRADMQLAPIEPTGAQAADLERARAALANDARREIEQAGALLSYEAALREACDWLDRPSIDERVT